MTRPYLGSPHEFQFAPNGGWASWFNQTLGRGISFSWHSEHGCSLQLRIRSAHGVLPNYTAALAFTDPKTCYDFGAAFIDSANARKQCWDWMNGGPEPTTRKGRRQ